MSNKTGGPAFPLAIDKHVLDDGMTLRDYFAAKAMQALVSVDQMRTHDYVAKDAYGYADAMLKARGQ
jgi:hypothetical protein